jgi:DinB superfamily
MPSTPQFYRHSKTGAIDMQVEVTPTLIDMYRETFEGAIKPDWCWIVSGPADASVLGSLAGLSAERAYSTSDSRHKSIAAHAAHLKYTLDLTLQRLHGENPPADWASSFDVGTPSPAAWTQLQQELRGTYDAVLAFFEQQRGEPVSEWQPIHTVGLIAMIGHNAYHLGAIRQLIISTRNESTAI